MSRKERQVYRSNKLLWMPTRFPQIRAVDWKKLGVTKLTLPQLDALEEMLYTALCQGRSEAPGQDNWRRWSDVLVTVEGTTGYTREAVNELREVVKQLHGVMKNKQLWPVSDDHKESEERGVGVLRT